jgi:hypothetical protein
MISDEFNSFLANLESPLFVAGNPDRLCRVGQPFSWALLKLASLPGSRSAFARTLETEAAQPRR